MSKRRAASLQYNYPVGLLTEPAADHVCFACVFLCVYATTLSATLREIGNSEMEG